MKKFKLFLILIIPILFLTIILPAKCQEAANPSPPEDLEYATGRVIQITNQQPNKALESTFGGDQTIQTVKIKVLSGEEKGKITETENQLTSNAAYDIKIKPGSRVILDIEKTNNKNKPEVYIADVERMPALMILFGLFLTLLLVIGGLKGLKSIISLTITSSLVVFALIPAILNKCPIIPITILVSLASTLLTMFLVGGINLKSVAASIGTISGVGIAGLIATLIIKIAPLSGLTDNEAIMLWSSRPDLNFTGLLTSAMIIGSLGAIMDVGISIASSIAEVKTIDSSLTRSQLIQSGLNVGKDIMGAMSNTLILAYIGGAFPLMLLAANAPLIKLINLNSIATEITAAIAGSIGIILCVPITAFVSGYLMSRESNPIDLISENTNA